MAPETMAAAHQILNLLEEIMVSIGLGDKAAVIGNVDGTGPIAPRRNHKQNLWPARMNLAHQIHAVEGAGHLNICEKQRHVASVFKHPQSVGGVARFDNSIPMLFEQIRRAKANKLLVLDNQDDRRRKGLDLAHVN